MTELKDVHMFTCEYKFRVQLIFVASRRRVMTQSSRFTLDHQGTSIYNLKMNM